MITLDDNPINMLCVSSLMYVYVLALPGLAWSGCRELMKAVDMGTRDLNVHPLPLTNINIITTPLTPTQRLSFYSSSSVFIIPHHAERWYTPLIDALGVGTAVLIPHKSGPKFLMNEMNCFALVAIDEIDGVKMMRKTMRHLSSSQALVKQVGKQGQTSIFHSFDMNVILNVFISHLSNVRLTIHGGSAPIDSFNTNNDDNDRLTAFDVSVPEVKKTDDDEDVVDDRGDDDDDDRRRRRRRQRDDRKRRDDDADAANDDNMHTPSAASHSSKFDSSHSTPSSVISSSLASLLSSPSSSTTDPLALLRSQLRDELHAQLSSLLSETKKGKKKRRRRDDDEDDDLDDDDDDYEDRRRRRRRRRRRSQRDRDDDDDNDGEDDKKLKTKSKSKSTRDLKSTSTSSSKKSHEEEAHDL